MFWYKLFNVRHDVVLAMCDEELLGKTLDFEGINIKVSEVFYKGDVIGDDGAIKLMELSSIGNLIGKKIVGLAEERGFILKNNILFIGDVPHAQFVKIT